MTHRRVEIEGGVLRARSPAVRTSLTDGPPMLWGFQVRVLENGAEIAIKTCFVGRVSVQFRDEAALDGPIEGLLPVLHELAFEKIEERLRGRRAGGRDPLRLSRLRRPERPPRTLATHLGPARSSSAAASRRRPGRGPRAPDTAAGGRRAPRAQPTASVEPAAMGPTVCDGAAARGEAAGRLPGRG